MKTLRLLIAFAFIATTTMQAQSVKLKWKQITGGTIGQIPIANASGIGEWTNSPFLKYTDTSAMLGSYIRISQKGANNGVATLDGSGKIPSAQIPAIALSETYVVNSVSAMLALSAAEIGDIAVRTDSNQTYILSAAGYSNYANWVKVRTPGTGVSSVGMTVPTGLQVSGSPITGSGTFGVTLQSGYSIPTTAKQANWDTAFNRNPASLTVSGTNTKTISLTLQSGQKVEANFTDLQSAGGSTATDAAQQFTGSTSNTITLANSPSAIDHLMVSLNGQILTAADFSVSGATLTLSNITRETSDYVIVYYAY